MPGDTRLRKGLASRWIQERGLAHSMAPKGTRAVSGCKGSPCSSHQESRTATRGGQRGAEYKPEKKAEGPPRAATCQPLERPLVSIMCGHTNAHLRPPDQAGSRVQPGEGLKARRTGPCRAGGFSAGQPGSPALSLCVSRGVHFTRAHYRCSHPVGRTWGEDRPSPRRAPLLLFSC